jgi:uncharacterized phage protein (TIGR01671 family)
MREIKFRAINSLGKMIYGLPYTDGTNDTIYFEKCSNRLCWRDEDGNHCNQPYTNGTLMQFTGLKDKNGKEIYEGDFLQSMTSGDFVVTFEDGEFRAHNDHVTISREAWKYRLVTGNIYENPELLKEKAN